MNVNMEAGPDHGTRCQSEINVKLKNVVNVKS
jgi:hypothetical protein